ncbi:MAG: Uncharacterized protein XD64_0463 [Thermotoga sp. 47_83]|jgi:hypothetical protein|uniref:Uncharacterized protein n=3 Tax=Thermotogaceae TaxID=188709 RepID=D2C778_THEP2|nr:hypothetical protein [Thermotoga sp. Xyl54]ACB09210.1 conserved hypothetical protein [Thermotoga sp. RQ2]ADA66814.1 conserved hypothetical protein [Thermotoga petrophila RKU-10]AIY86415.1 hypothetical protein T2812B_04350 [Thermotoga sp. 2812B]EJX26351.1 hypothetical protein EMP_04975 [Thermotoga sp. EMP]KHC90613.1 hypothetical protein TBGT1765_08866 [Thermotoga sp. TBGT1765]KHC90962.1 hypothetical protein TBGT1766_08536 [Thermotoga sp. TBGT1766]KUK23021.1 MAG: Uncharacterized protein XD5
MNRRTVILLVIMGVVWSFVLFYLFAGNRESGTLQVERPTDFTALVNKIQINPLLKKTAQENPPEFSYRVFNPVTLSFGKEAADTLIVTLPPLKYRFLGFIRTGDGLKVFLSDGEKLFEVSGESPSFGNYVVTYVSSLGVLVLDVENGRFFSIR